MDGLRRLKALNRSFLTSLKGNRNPKPTLSEAMVFSYIGPLHPLAILWQFSEGNLLTIPRISLGNPSATPLHPKAIHRQSIGHKQSLASPGGNPSVIARQLLGNLSVIPRQSHGKPLPMPEQSLGKPKASPRYPLPIPGPIPGSLRNPQIIQRQSLGTSKPIPW